MAMFVHTVIQKEHTAFLAYTLGDLSTNNTESKRVERVTRLINKKKKGDLQTTIARREIFKTLGRIGIIR